MAKNGHTGCKGDQIKGETWPKDSTRYSYNLRVLTQQLSTYGPSNVFARNLYVVTRRDDANVVRHCDNCQLTHTSTLLAHLTSYIGRTCSATSVATAISIHSNMEHAALQFRATTARTRRHSLRATNARLRAEFFIQMRRSRPTSSNSPHSTARLPIADNLLYSPPCTSNVMVNAIETEATVEETADLVCHKLFGHDRPQIQVNEPGMWQSAIPIS